MIYLALWLWLASGGDFSRVSQQAADARTAGRIPEALKLYRQAVALNPAWKEGWWYLGALLYNQDQYATARDALRRLVSLDPKAGPGFAFLGLCEYQTRQYREALADINQARRLGLGGDPEVRRVVLYHAMLLYTRFRQYESALQVLERVVRAGDLPPPLIEAAGLAGLRQPIGPEDMPAGEKDLVERAGRAVCAVAQHHTADAQKYFKDLLEHYPDAPNVHYLYGTFLLTDDADAGLREFQKELALNPRHVEALVTTALEYERRGETDKAIAYAQRAVSADPQYFAAHGVLGRLLANSGQVKKGVKELEIARAQAPDSPQVHFALATAYEMAGRKQDAAHERAEFLRLKKLADETMGR